MQNLFGILAVIFAVVLLILLVGSRPTDFGAGVTPFAIPVSICSAGFAIASALLSKK